MCVRSFDKITKLRNNIMLKCIVVIQFVALLSLSLAGTSIADPPKPPPPDTTAQDSKKQLEFIKETQKALDSQARKNPQPSTGPKAAGSTASHTKGKQ
jgi:hypothetical protein